MPAYRDLKFALRILARQPGFSLMVIGMLGLGIAGASAIFSLYNGLFLAPLPFPEAERLVDLDEVAPKWNLEFVGIAYQDFHVWRSQNRTFEGMAVWDDESFNLSGLERPERVEGARVTHDLLAVLRIRPALGRGFLAEEDRPGGAKVALIGYGLWQRIFGGKQDVLGQKLQLNSESYTVVGVLPLEAVLPARAELWIPLALSTEEFRGWYLNGVGRLKADASIGQARDDLTRIHRGMIETRQVNEITSPKLLPLRERYLGNLRLVTMVLLAAVAVVLLIACVNIAGLMLARGAVRTRELGIRAALGASRGRLVRQLLTESLVLSVAGGVLGVALGSAALKSLITIMPDQLPRWVRFSLDTRFLLFSIGVSVAAAVLFGLWPALEASRVDVRGALHDASARTSASAGRRRSLNALVVGEVALAVVLLVGAGLLIQAFVRLQKVDPGFRPQGVLMYRVSLPEAKYGKPEQRRAFFQHLVARHRAMPGVEAAAAISAPPLGGHWGNFFDIENAPPSRPNEQDPVVLVRIATPGYFRAMGVTLLGGRDFTEADGRTEGSQGAIVNESFAKRFFPDTDPLGKRIRFRGSRNPWMTVLGLAKDVKHYGVDQEMRPGVYVPHTQNASSGMSIVARTSVEPLSLVAASRDILRAMDPEIPMFQITTMARRLEESLWVRRAYSWLLAVFAGVALLLAIGGTYGVISYTVSSRTNEIGIRMALGAQPGQLLREVLGQGMLLAVLGLVLGLAGAFWSARLMESLLFGSSARDPLTYGAVSLILFLAALAANFLPARRAAAIDPMTALRFE
jgi:predicted permease